MHIFILYDGKVHHNILFNEFNLSIRSCNDFHQVKCYVENVSQS